MAKTNEDSPVSQGELMPERKPVAPSTNWRVDFEDESVEITSSYNGDRAKYTSVEEADAAKTTRLPLAGASNIASLMTSLQSALPPNEHIYQSYQDFTEPAEHNHTTPYPVTTWPGYDESQSDPLNFVLPYSSSARTPQSPPFIDDKGEVLCMQIYVEEVAAWMDSIDEEEHFAHMLPVQALHQPILKKALLACGSRHLVLIDPEYTIEFAAKYHDTAIQMLLRLLRNPNRDTVLRAITATVLNVYEIMYKKHTSFNRANHNAVLLQGL